MRTDLWNQLALALLLGVLLTGMVVAQEGVWQGDQGHPMLPAALRDKDKNAQKHSAVVEVETRNIGLLNLGISSYGSDVGLLEYQVDQAPFVVTADTRIMFCDLAPGKHTITVSLVNTEYKQLGAKAELEVDVP